MKIDLKINLGQSNKSSFLLKSTCKIDVFYPQNMKSQQIKKI